MKSPAACWTPSLFQNIWSSCFRIIEFYSRPSYWCTLLMTWAYVSDIMAITMFSMMMLRKQEVAIIRMFSHREFSFVSSKAP